ncbi:FAD-binding Berberine family protein [Striga hermonthica]|uniref:FAD-binding Berberine family protein n=1 Tax=Striga hermonthica TaxID=68872 RepID=A0A9N7NBL6_STRHE|nr:FAD-binding Berberine family protein [Striga hermonthica]
MDDSLFIRVLLQPVTLNKTRIVRVTFIGLYLGDSDGLLSILGAQFPELGLTRTDAIQMRWIDSVLFWANYDNTTSPDVLLGRRPDSVNFLKRKFDYVKSPIPLTGIHDLFDKIVEIGKVGLVFNSYGGVKNQIPGTATPFPHRVGNLFKIQYSVNWEDEDEEVDRKYVGQIMELYSYMTPYVSKNPREAYLNYRDLDIGTIDDPMKSYEQGRVYGLKYFKNNFDRLVRVKTRVNPDNVFRNEKSIPVLEKFLDEKRMGDLNS